MQISDFFVVLSGKTITQSYTKKLKDSRRKMKLNNISKLIIGSAIEVHKKLGPGLLESAYKKCLSHELKQNELLVREEVPRPIE